MMIRWPGIVMQIRLFAVLLAWLNRRSSSLRPRWCSSQVRIKVPLNCRMP